MGGGIRNPLNKKSKSSIENFLKRIQYNASDPRFEDKNKELLWHSQFYIENTKKLKLGNGLDPDTNVGPLANKRGLDHIDKLVRDAENKGAEILLGGAPSKKFNKGYFYEPTVLKNVPHNADILKIEPFGPVAPIIKVTDESKLFEMANSTEFGLAGYVFTSSLKRAHIASESLEVGMVGVNDMLLAAAEIPFGGVKESGFGREGGSLGILDYLVPKYTKFKIY